MTLAATATTLAPGKDLSACTKSWETRPAPRMPQLTVGASSAVSSDDGLGINVLGWCGMAACAYLLAVPSSCACCTSKGTGSGGVAAPPCGPPSAAPVPLLDESIDRSIKWSVSQSVSQSIYTTPPVDQTQKGGGHIAQSPLNARIHASLHTRTHKIESKYASKGALLVAAAVLMIPRSIDCAAAGAPACLRVGGGSKDAWSTYMRKYRGRTGQMRTQARLRSIIP